MCLNLAELPCTKIDFCQRFVYILAAFREGKFCSLPAPKASSRGAHRRQKQGHDGAWFREGEVIKVILLQSGLVAMAAAIAAGLVGAQGATSVLIGGAAYMLPNLLFVLRLALAGRRANAMTFFAGEFFKIAATIGILAVAVRFLEVHWLCLLIGLFAALKANLFALLLKN
jgi:ATP synthase protein I